MSVATVPAGDFDDMDDLEFAAIVADYDTPTPVHRPSKAAVRREAREQINAQLGIVRHRTGERQA